MLMRRIQLRERPNFLRLLFAPITIFDLYGAFVGRGTRNSSPKRGKKGKRGATENKKGARSRNNYDTGIV